MVQLFNIPLCSLLRWALDALKISVNLYHGDITILPVDVIVNAINPQLKYTRGVAEAIVKAGGPCIQSDSEVL